MKKVSLSYSAFENPSLIREASNKFGKQSIVCCLDVKIENNKNYNIYVNNGSKIRINLKQAILNFVNNGAGEIIINNIDRDGTYSGVDKQLIKETLEICTIPITFVGGLSSYSNIKELNQEFDISGLSAGSLFGLF